MKRNLFSGVLTLLLAAFITTSFAQKKSKSKDINEKLSQLIKCDGNDLELELSYHSFNSRKDKLHKKGIIVDKGIMGDVYIDWANNSKERNSFQKQNLLTLQELAFIQSQSFQNSLINTSSKEQLSLTMAKEMNSNTLCFNRAIKLLQEDTPERKFYIDSISHFHQGAQKQAVLWERPRTDDDFFFFLRTGVSGLRYSGSDIYFNDYGFGGNVNAGISIGGFIIEANSTITRSPKPKSEYGIGLTDITYALGVGGVIGSSSFMQIIPTIGGASFVYLTGEPGNKAGYTPYIAVTFVPASRMIYKYGPGGMKKYRHGLYFRISAQNKAFHVEGLPLEDKNNLTITLSVGYSFTYRKFKI